MSHTALPASYGNVRETQRLSTNIVLDTKVKKQSSDSPYDALVRYVRTLDPRSQPTFYTISTTKMINVWNVGGESLVYQAKSRFRRLKATDLNDREIADVRKWLKGQQRKS